MHEFVSNYNVIIVPTHQNEINFWMIVGTYIKLESDLATVPVLAQGSPKFEVIEYDSYGR